MSNLALWLLVHAQQHTTNAGLHFGCTGTDEPLITLHAADWAIIWVSRIRYWRLHCAQCPEIIIYTIQGSFVTKRTGTAYRQTNKTML